MFKDEFNCEDSLDNKKAWVYDFFYDYFLFLLKYLEISFTSLGNLAGIEGGRVNMKVGFAISLTLTLA